MKIALLPLLLVLAAPSLALAQNDPCDVANAAQCTIRTVDDGGPTFGECQTQAAQNGCSGGTNGDCSFVACAYVVCSEAEGAACTVGGETGTCVNRCELDPDYCPDDDTVVCQPASAVPPSDGDGGGCATQPGTAPGLLLLAFGLLVSRRSRSSR